MLKKGPSEVKIQLYLICLGVLFVRFLSLPALELSFLEVCSRVCLLQFMVTEEEESLSNEGSKLDGMVTINVK